MSAPPNLRVRVPGKAMLAGEYAVLFGAPALVCAVDRHLTCEVASAERFAIEGAGVRWSEGEPDAPALRFAIESARIARCWLAGRGIPERALHLRIHDDLRAPDGSKLGLGGSACTSVAVVAALLAGAGLEPDRGVVFKLAAAAHVIAQGKAGSALDIAASTFGGTLWARRFEARALVAAARGGPKVLAAAMDWTALPELERLPAPPALLLAYSGVSASTAGLIREVERFGGADPRGFGAFVARTSAACDRLRRALKASDTEGAMTALRTAGIELDALGSGAGVGIVTDAHRRIIAAVEGAGWAAKVSGAGGGDCCVALGAVERTSQVLAAIETAGFLAVCVGVDPGGFEIA